jgi:transcriptional regulator with XRE-family HTH domain
MDSSTPIGKLIAALKQELKKRDLHYRDVAKRLSVSEATVKRYLKGKGVNIEALQKLAEIVDLDLLSLASLAEQQNTKLPGLTGAQEGALVRNKNLRMVFALAIRGWPLDVIARELDIAAQMGNIVTRLEALGLVRKVRDTVRILARPPFGPVVTGELGEHARSMARYCLKELDFGDENCRWLVNGTRLSDASAQRLQEMMTHFMAEVLAMSMKDVSLPPNEAKWHGIMLAAQPMSLKKALG